MKNNRQKDFKPKFMTVPSKYEFDGKFKSASKKRNTTSKRFNFKK